MGKAKKKEKRVTALFFGLLCLLATLVILTPPTPIEKQLHTHVIYIHNPQALGHSNTSAVPPSVQSNSSQGSAAKESERRNRRKDDEEGEESDGNEVKEKDYKNCPRLAATGKARPPLKGMPFDFTRGRHRFSINDTFIHAQNYKQLLHGEYRLHRHTIPLLPESYEDIVEEYKFDSCAVVGSSGYLKLAQFGEAIDTHDVVVRMNQSPVKAYARWAGRKTTMRILNSLWSAHYGAGRYEPMGLPLEKNVTIIVSRTTGHAFDKIVDTMSKKRPDVKVIQLSSRIVSAARRLLVSYRVKLCQRGYGPYTGGSTPSSGFVAVYWLHKICRRVTLYGLGSVNVPNVPYHYFGGVGSRKKGNPVHSFDSESALLDAMGREDRVEQCKYRTRDFVLHGKETMSKLKKSVPEFSQFKYHNRFCGWNLCNKRYHHKLGQMIKSAQDVRYEDCKKIMYKARGNS